MIEERDIKQMKLDQVAFYCATDEAASSIKHSFGLADKEWIKDTVTSDNIVYPPTGDSIRGEAIGELQFNYDLGIELEILKYVQGPNWFNFTRVYYNNAMRVTSPFISHIGFHINDGPWPELDEKWRLIQKTKTKSHSNPYLIDKGYTYDYRIYESIPGTYLKFIKRNVNNGQGQ